MKDFQKSMISLDEKEQQIAKDKRALVKRAKALMEEKESLFLTIHDNYVKVMAKIQSVADFINSKVDNVAEGKKNKITEEVASLDNFVNRYKNI